MSDLAGIYDRIGNNTERIWKLLAYVARYGHQPVDVSKRLPLRELKLLADQLAKIVEEENAPPNAEGGFG